MKIHLNELQDHFKDETIYLFGDFESPPINTREQITIGLGLSPRHVQDLTFYTNSPFRKSWETIKFDLESREVQIFVPATIKLETTCTQICFTPIPFEIWPEKDQASWLRDPGDNECIQGATNLECAIGLIHRMGFTRIITCGYYPDGKIFKSVSNSFSLVSAREKEEFLREWSLGLNLSKLLGISLEKL